MNSFMSSDSQSAAKGPVPHTTTSKVFEGWMGEALVTTVRSAERVGLLDELGSPWVSLDELAERLALPTRALSLLLPMLSTLGYVEENEGRYRRPGDPERLREPWPQLEAFVRSGAVPDIIDDPARRGAYYAKAVMGLAEAFHTSAVALAEQLAPVRSIVELGAGSAVWSAAMALGRANTRVLAVDRPEVLPSAKKWAELLGVGDQLRTQAADYFEVEVDEPVDRVVMANVLHLETAADAARLVERAARMLTVDGDIVIIDSFAPDSFLSEVFNAAYALHLGMRTEKGRAHHEEELRAWCREAGLVHQELIRLGDQGLAVLVASRRGVVTQQREMTSIPAADLRQLYAERDANRSRFTMVFEGAADAIMVVDKQGRDVGRINDSFRQLFDVDWSASEMHPLEDVVAPDDVERCRGILTGLAKGTVQERRHRVRMLRNGVSFNAEITAYDPHARSVLLLLVRDLDRVARAEKLQALGELVGGLIHDLNTPVGSLKASCALAHDAAQRVASSEGCSARDAYALGRATSDALRALDQVSAKLDSIRTFANLEGPALRALSEHVTDGLAHAICSRAAGDAASSHDES